MGTERHFGSDDAIMQHAIELAQAGFGTAEPNPLVGAVLVDRERRLIAAGWHARCGGPHAEIVALQQAGEAAHGQDLFVTLEPCCHTGRTPPCADAVIAAGIRRVVVGCQDPAPWVAGQGLDRLRAAGVIVECGCCEQQAKELIAPFRRRVVDRLPWVHAKWAMTLDGRIAADSGHSKWISGTESRAVVHELRGRMDAIVTAAGTVRADDPLLTARPVGPRRALRVVLDASGQSLNGDSLLLQTLDQADVLICVTELCPPARREELQRMGLQLLVTSGQSRVSLREVLGELAAREMTHVLLEAGPALLGSAFDEQLVDEVHVFVAPKVIGGTSARSAVAGVGLKTIPDQSLLRLIKRRVCGEDLLIEGRIIRSDVEKS